MKKFFSIMSVVMLVAVVTTVLVWLLLQASLPAAVTTRNATLSDETVSESSDMSTTEMDDSLSENNKEAAASTESQTAATRIQLNDSQRQTAESFGINPDAVEITPAMIDCAKGKLSAERLDELVHGATPSFAESLALLPCVTAE